MTADTDPGKGDKDGINHNGLLEFVAEKGGVAVPDNKRGNIPAELVITGTNGNSRLEIHTGPGKREVYPVDDKDAIAKILSEQLLEGNF